MVQRKEREWSMCSHSSYYCYEERHMLVTVTAQTSHERAGSVFKMVIWCVSIALGPYSSSYLCVLRPSILLILDLIALPPIPTSSRVRMHAIHPLVFLALLIVDGRSDCPLGT